MSRLAIIGLVGRSMFFEVPRFHTGGETVTAKGLYEEWGGKGFNQAIAAARQNAAVAFLGACASADKKPIDDFCRTEGVTAKLCAKKRSTACAAILTDGSGETRVTVYPGAELEAKDVDGFAGSIAMADFLLLNNEVPDAVNRAAIDVAKQYGVKVIFNPAPARHLPREIVDAVDLFTPNEFEERLLDDYRPFSAETITTLGARGCRIRSTGEIIPAPHVTPVDSTGAGDTFTATLAIHLADGDPLRDACVAANEAAAQSTTIKYVMPSLPRY